MIIKKFETSDLPALAQIYLDARRETFHWMPEESFKLFDFFKDTLGEEIYVIFDKVITVGFISVWKPDSFIHHLYIDSNNQNKGYGKKLLSYALTTLPRPVGLKCVVQNERAVAFYQKQGWKIKESGTDEMGPYYFFEMR
jgi:GNAT superfamily N-acetyltransferase